MKRNTFLLLLLSLSIIAAVIFLITQKPHGGNRAVKPFQRDTFIEDFGPESFQSDTLFNYNGSTYSISVKSFQKKRDYIYQSTDSAVYGYLNNYHNIRVFRNKKLLWERTLSKQDLMKETFYSADSSDHLPYCATLALANFETMAWDENLVISIPMVFPDSDFGEQIFLVFDKQGKIIHNGVGMGYGGSEIDGGYHAYGDWLFLPEGVLNKNGEKQNFYFYPNHIVGGNRRLNDSTIIWFMEEEGKETARLMNMRTATFIDSFESNYLVAELGYSLNFDEVAKGKWVGISDAQNDSVLIMSSANVFDRRYVSFRGLKLCPDARGIIYHHDTAYYRIAWDAGSDCPCIAKYDLTNSEDFQ